MLGEARAAEAGTLRRQPPLTESEGVAQPLPPQELGTHGIGSPSDAATAQRTDTTGTGIISGRRQKEWDWTKVCGPFDTEQTALKAKQDVSPGNWAYNQAAGISRKWLRCNVHADCPVLLKVAHSVDGYHLCILEGVEHAAMSKLKRRKNSILTYDEETLVEPALRSGKKPRQVVEDVQATELQKLEADDVAPQKKAEGGLEGMPVV